MRCASAGVVPRFFHQIDEAQLLQFVARRRAGHPCSAPERRRRSGLPTSERSPSRRPASMPPHRSSRSADAPTRNPRRRSPRPSLRIAPRTSGRPRSVPTGGSHGGAFTTLSFAPREKQSWYISTKRLMPAESMNTSPAQSSSMSPSIPASRFRTLGTIAVSNSPCSSTRATRSAVFNIAVSAPRPWTRGRMKARHV